MSRINAGVEDGDNDSGTRAHAPGIFGAELVQRPLKVACSTVRFRSIEDLARLDGGGGDARGSIERARGQGWIVGGYLLNVEPAVRVCETTVTASGTSAGASSVVGGTSVAMGGVVSAAVWFAGVPVVGGAGGSGLPSADDQGREDRCASH
jgi:hypothetical protein